MNAAVSGPLVCVSDPNVTMDYTHDSPTEVWLRYPKVRKVHISQYLARGDEYSSLPSPLGAGSW